MGKAVKAMRLALVSLEKTRVRVLPMQALQDWRRSMRSKHIRVRGAGRRGQ